MQTCNILGVNISVTNIKETVEYIEKNVESLKGNYICVSNVHTTVIAYENKTYRDIQNNGILALPDGGPLSLVSKMRGYKEAERVTGPDLMEAIFEISQKNGYKHFFYGSTENTLKKMEENLRLKYPSLNIIGMYSPPFKKEIEQESEKLLSEINMKSPDFIWVGLGAPKQEVWMKLHENKINGLMIGVGAGFDYFAGNIKRAPLWMQKNNLEWFYRLIQDPKRLYKRYMTTNSKFIWNVIIRGR